MRTLVLTLGILCGAAIMPASQTAGAFGAIPAMGATVAVVDAHAVNQPALALSQAPQINVEVNKGGGGRWYANPVWIAIGGIAALLLIVLIVMAARGGGGGTTVVRG